MGESRENGNVHNDGIFLKITRDRDLAFSKNYNADQYVTACLGEAYSQANFSINTAINIREAL